MISEINSTSYLLGREQYPAIMEAGKLGTHLILHFDFNKTLIAKDAIGGKDENAVLNELLTEYFVDRWSLDSESMSYYQHVVKQCPGNKYEKGVRAARFALLHRFVEKLEEEGHPRAQEARELYKTMREQIAKNPLFYSFVKLLDVLQQADVKATVVLRTFGSELVEGMGLIEKIVPEARFTLTGRVKSGKICLNERDARFVDDEGKLIAEGKGRAIDGKVVEVFQKHRFVGIQDDFDSWKIEGRNPRFGKPFPFEKNGEETFSLFFDDNIRQDDLKNIVAPMDLRGAFVPPTEALKKGRLRRVKTIDAIIDDDYFLKALERALAFLPDNRV